QISQVEFSAEAAERGKFAHYMLKEIFEQPRTVENAVRGRMDHEEATAKFGGLNMTTAELRAVDQIVIAACGTSWHAALIGEHLLEEFAHMPVEVEYASELRYRNAPIETRMLALNRGLQLIRALEAVPEQMEKILAQNDLIKNIALKYASAEDFFFLGRLYNFPVALEGALKLKEISYIHAEGYPAAEMKHGPIALIDAAMPVVFIAPHDAVFDKVVSNIMEVKARGGQVICVTSQEEPVLKGKIDFEFRIPQTVDML